MGIDIYALTFLKFISNRRDFNKTLTIGRQSLLIDEQEFEDIFRKKKNYIDDKYCEEMLQKNLSASQVDSLDNSKYENATFIHDMNTDIPLSMHNQYNTVIDAGSLEHIFNVSQAIKNCSQLLKEGGQVIHILPANNFCGHGFWQFSPELFFSLYSENNGYEDLFVFLVDLTNPYKWYRIKKPNFGDRLNISSSNQMCIFVSARLKSKTFKHDNIQQSDYVYRWNNKEELRKTELYFYKFKKEARKIIKKNYLFGPLYWKIMGYKFRKNNSLKSSRENISLVKASRMVE
ncbi:hypothetical protein FD961_01635 [Polynucleobacter sp. TSB-Sco08W16]|uniref:class I SAM-dependent methyltransferase n=1 Tax=Polynucleobacter sp. TSB-Sco08W16 TaxID=1758374 RepID=UPI001BFCFE29|nr:class I SAM-dependent methyltransferase [Polynucleobacter sp. TSB-Sco08W16]QWD74557.1 hypothetical protein FD961_01635 [Polynucleobacter sp. TSB-Sco08W16]